MTHAISDAIKARDTDILSLKKCLDHFEKVRDEYEKHTRFTKKYALLKKGNRCFLSTLLHSLSISVSLIFLYGFILSVYDLLGVADILPLSFSEAVVAAFTVSISISFLNSFYNHRRMIKLNKYISDTTESLKKHYEKYKNSPVSFEFSDPVYVECFINLLMNGRADSIKEAINIFMDDYHKQQVLQIHEQIAISAKSAAIAASNAARSAANAASAARWNKF